jgi:predicted Zn-dependent protease
MRTLAISVVALGASIFAVAQAPVPNADLLLRAMRDEVDRSAKVTVSGLAAPYFIEYLVDEEETFSVSASLGGVVSRRDDRFREPQIQVRVGDYQFDNTNFAGGFGGGRGGGGGLPVENSYPVLRRYFWLETDAAYKAAVEALSRKRAALRNMTQNDQINDFAHAAPVHFLGDFQRLAIDEEAWTNRVRSLSAVFTQFPSIAFSMVDLEASTGGFYIVNTEGTEVREPENVTSLRARATAQAPDGMNIADGVTFHSLDAGRMPSDAEMVRGITAMAQNIVALAAAPRGEDYTGPVIFEGQASAQILAEVLGRNLAPVRRPLGGRGGGRGGAAIAASELEGRIGARVLPDSFDVVDDPTLKEWHGRPLFGSYDVDREGVVPKPLHLIEKGVLKGFLLTREPVKGFEGSNGRARLPSGPGNSGAAISNLFVSSSDAVPAADLKKKLVELIQARSKPYGMLVRKLDFPSVGGGAAPAGGQPNGGRPVSAPIQLYKVYPDGREELVRGLRFRGLNVRSLKDILAAGDDSQAFEFMNTLRGFSAETCVVAPSILIDDLELYAPEEEQPKLPIAPPPEITR